MYKKIIAIVFIVFIIVVVVSIVLYTLAQVPINLFKASNLETSSTKGVITIFYGDSHADSYVLFMNVVGQRLIVLDVPGYTRYFSDETNKIIRLENAIYGKSPSQAVKVFTSLLETPVHFAISFSEDQLRSFVNLSGGMMVTLMREEVGVYQRETSVGEVYFDGDRTISYINKVSQKNAELLRQIERKEFLISLLEAMTTKESQVFFSHRKTLPIVMDNMDTTLSLKEMRRFMQILSESLDSTTLFQRISGEMRDIEIESGVWDKLLFLAPNGSAALNIVRDIEKEVFTTRKTPQNTTLEDKTRTRITILNGTPIVGLASRTKQVYEDTGFIVTVVGNANPTRVSTVIDHTGNYRKAEEVAQVLGIQNVITDLNSMDSAYEVTVVLGSDYNEDKGIVE